MFILKSLADFVKSADADAKDVASVAVDVNDALVQAATHNAHFAVKSLLRYARDLQITPDSVDAALVIASDRGFALVVETIVVYRGVVPVATLLQALGAANKHGHHNIIELLLHTRDKRWMQSVLKHFIQENWHHVVWVATHAFNIPVSAATIELAAKCPTCHEALTAVLAAPKKERDAVTRAGLHLIETGDAAALGRMMEAANAAAIPHSVLYWWFESAALAMGAAETEDAFSSAEALLDEFMRLSWRRLPPAVIQEALHTVARAPYLPVPENFIRYMADQHRKGVSFVPALVGALDQPSPAKAARIVQFTLQHAPEGTVDVAANGNEVLRAVLAKYAKLTGDIHQRLDAAYFAAVIVAMVVEYARRTGCASLGLSGGNFAPLFVLARGAMPDEEAVQQFAAGGFTHVADALQNAVEYLETVAVPRVTVPQQICEQLLAVSMLAESNWGFPHAVNVAFLVDSGRVPRSHYAAVHALWAAKVAKEKAKAGAGAD
jgi:hypothetical protein